MIATILSKLALGAILGGARKFLFETTAGLAICGVVAAGAAYKIGNWTGYRAGVADQKAAQKEVDAKASAEIRERVKDALDQIGADADSVDIDSILRGLAGN